MIILMGYTHCLRGAHNIAEAIIQFVNSLTNCSYSLTSDAFIRAQNAPNPFSAWTPPLTPQGELTMLPQTP